MDNLLAMWSSAKRRRGCHGYPHAARSINDQPNPSLVGVQVVVESLSRSSWNRCPVGRGIRIRAPKETAVGTDQWLANSGVDQAAAMA